MNDIVKFFVAILLFGFIFFGAGWGWFAMYEVSDLKRRIEKLERSQRTESSK